MFIILFTLLIYLFIYLFIYFGVQPSASWDLFGNPGPFVEQPISFTEAALMNDSDLSICLEPGDWCNLSTNMTVADDILKKIIINSTFPLHQINISCTPF